MKRKWLSIGIAGILALVVLRYLTAPDRSAEEWLASPLESQLIEAAGTGDTATVRTLLDKGANVNAKNQVFGHTALIVAARQGYADTVQTLLGRGAEVDAEDNYGATALQWAEKNGHAEIVALLKQAGAQKPSTPAMRTIQDRSKAL